MVNRMSAGTFPCWRVSRVWALAASAMAILWGQSWLLHGQPFVWCYAPVRIFQNSTHRFWNPTSFSCSATICFSGVVPPFVMLLCILVITYIMASLMLMTFSAKHGMLIIGRPTWCYIPFSYRRCCQFSSATVIIWACPLESFISSVHSVEVSFKVWRLTRNCHTWVLDLTAILLVCSMWLYVTQHLFFHLLFHVSLWWLGKCSKTQASWCIHKLDTMTCLQAIMPRCITGGCLVCQCDLPSPYVWIHYRLEYQWHEQYYRHELVLSYFSVVFFTFQLCTCTSTCSVIIIIDSMYTHILVYTSRAVHVVLCDWGKRTTP